MVPTPPQPASVSPHWRPVPSVPYAGFWLRVVAYLLDSLIIGVAMIAVCVPLFFLFGGLAFIRSLPQNHGEPGPEFIFQILAFEGIFILIALLGCWFYYAYFESSSWQATVGKKVMNLYVTDLNTNPVSFGRASGRFFAKIITGLIPLGIGYILAGVTEKKQALHDMIASCLVLRRY
jgi:uncharacterized RDD family membrane protein YckC